MSGEQGALAGSGIEVRGARWVNSASFWYPDFLSPSAWLDHAPFAFWLASVLRPRSFVELGTHHGYSYFAFCQAVQRLGLATRCYAVDTWKGDKHAGFYGPEVFSRVNEHNAARYPAFSRLIEATFDEALLHFSDRSIDLLHIDGRHFYEDVKHDFTQWCPKLSDRAIVLFHDTNVRDRGFGVFRLWEELRCEFPGFEFLHGHGLGVLGYGASFPAEVGSLFAATADPGIAAEVRAIYDRLGGAIKANFGSGEIRAQLSEKANAHKMRLAAQMAEHEKQRVHAAELTAALQARQNEARELAAKLGTREAESRQLVARLKEQEMYAAELREKARKREREIRNLKRSVSWRATAPLRNMKTGLRKIERDIFRPAGKAIRAIVGGGFKQRTIERPSNRSSTTSVQESRPAPIATGKIILLSGEAVDRPGYVYRVVRYAEAFRKLGEVTQCISLSDLPKCFDEIRQCKLFVIWRARLSADVEKAIALARDAGVRVIFDLDDLMIHPELATANIIDAIRFEKRQESQIQAHYSLVRDTMLRADFCTATTHELAWHMRKRQNPRPTFVLPNGFGADTYARSRVAVRRESLLDDGLIRIGYASGSRTHQGDFALCADAVARILKQYPQCRLVLFRHTDLMTLDPTEFEVFEELEGQIEWRSFVPHDCVPDEIARFDINLAPLEYGNPFCEAKSELKFFEAAIADVCTVASPTGPFQRAIRHGETGFLAGSSDEWHSILLNLVQHRDLRQSIGRAAHRDVLWPFGPTRRVEAAHSVLKQIEGGRNGVRAFHYEIAEALRQPMLIKVPDREIVFERDKREASRVTVIIPLYNYEQYLTETLESVKSQTLQDLDLVVVDDCSTDSSLATACVWAEKNSDRFNRVIIARHFQNQGLGASRNTAFDLADSLNVMVLDADNRLRPECCSACLALMEATGAAFVYPKIQQFGDARHIMGSREFLPAEMIPANGIDAMAMVSKEVWALVGGYSDSRRGWQDYDFWCRIIERGLTGANTHEILAEYRVHAASMLRTMTNQEKNKHALLDLMERDHPWLSLTAQQRSGHHMRYEPPTD